MDRKFDKENVLKGEILWKKLWKVYREQTEEAHKNSAPFTTKMQLFSRKKISSKPTVSVNVFSDGAGLGNYNSHSGKGLTGYGYGFIGFQEGKVFQPSVIRSEYKFRPSTITEAEALGALKAVVHAKKTIRNKGGRGLRVNLTTDCLDVIEGLHKMPEVLRKISEINETPREQWSNYIKSRHNELLLIRDLANELYNDPLIESVTTNWVKGHVLDSTPINDLRFVEEYLNYMISKASGPGEEHKFKEEKLVFHNMRNNKLADKMALEGAVRGLTKRLDFLASKDHDTVMVQQEAIRTSIALTNSIPARMIAIEYVASHRDDFLDKDTIKCLFGDTGLSDIAKKKDKLAHKYGCEKNDLENVVMSSHNSLFERRIIDDYTSKKEVPFLRKFGNLDIA